MVDLILLRKQISSNRFVSCVIERKKYRVPPSLDSTTDYLSESYVRKTDKHEGQIMIHRILCILEVSRRLTIQFTEDWIQFK